MATDAGGEVVARAGTDAVGCYSMPGLRSGTYTVVASVLSPASTQVRVSAGEPVRTG